MADYGLQGGGEEAEKRLRGDYMPSYFVKLSPLDFNPNQNWMVAHVIDLSTYGSNEAEVFAHEEQRIWLK